MILMRAAIEDGRWTEGCGALLSQGCQSGGHRRPARFLRAGYAARDTLLGEGLAHFFETSALGAAAPNTGGSGAIPQGIYEAETPARPAVTMIRPGATEASQAPSDKSEEPPLRMIVTRVSGKAYAELKEQVARAASPEGRIAKSERREAFDGVLFATGQGLYALMRSTLTRLPKGYGITLLPLLVNDEPAYGLTCLCLIPYLPPGLPESACAAGTELTFTPALESLS